MASTSGAEVHRKVISDTENEQTELNKDRKILKKRLKLTKRRMEAQTDTDSDDIDTVEKTAKKTEKEVERMEDTNDEEAKMMRAFILKNKKRRITDENDSTFTHPTGAKITPNRTTKTETLVKNRFETSSKIISEKDMHVIPPQQPETTENDTQNKEKPKRPPPPIVIHGLFKDHKYLNDFLSSKIRGKFHWKHSRNTTILQVSTYEDWVVANKNFELGKLEYHTYTPREDKTHAFVLKGLYHDVEIEQIKEELTIEYDIPVKTIYLMKGTKFQLFMVVTSNDVTLKHLEKTVKYVDHTVIKWERHVNSKRIIQCHRCQMWGHATSNCRASPRCLKCAQQHLTNQCPRTMEDPIKCVNCGEAHTANSVNCKVYQDKIWQIEQKKCEGAPTSTNEICCCYCSKNQCLGAKVPAKLDTK